MLPTIFSETRLPPPAPEWDPFQRHARGPLHTPAPFRKTGGGLIERTARGGTLAAISPTPTPQRGGLGVRCALVTAFRDGGSQDSVPQLCHAAPGAGAYPRGQAPSTLPF